MGGKCMCTQVFVLVEGTARTKGSKWMREGMLTQVEPSSLRGTLGVG